MKKLLSIAVLIVYFCTTTGFVFSIHYCMERMNGTGMSAVNSKGGKCGMEKNKGCCRDHVKVIKLQTVHLTPKILSAEFHTHAIAKLTTAFIASPLKNCFSTTIYIGDSPPADEQDTWLQNRVLRI